MLDTNDVFIIDVPTEGLIFIYFIYLFILITILLYFLLFLF